MKPRHALVAAVAAASFLAVVAPGVASAAPVSGQPPCENRSATRLNVIALTANGRLICVGEHRANRPREIGTVTGLVGDVSLVGIDFRPANGKLYGLSTSGGIYTIDTTTAVATKVSQANVALIGTSFGIDFNPVVDRLRVVSDTGQNLAVNVDDGTTATNTGLTLAANPAPALGVTAVAYTNNDADPNTATTLFDIDTVNDQVAIQSPPAGGVLAAAGKLGVDASAVAGLDIFAVQKRGTTVANTAMALLTVDGRSGPYRVDALTGRVNRTSLFPADYPVTDIAIPLER